MKITVRATRAYLAGFGTSGSLLAGAAVLFVLGSAIVAFRGWPQIATGPDSVVVAASHRAAPTRVARRLAAVLRTNAITGGAALAPRAGRRATRSRGSRFATGAAPSGSRNGSPASPTGSSATAGTVAGPSVACGSSCNQPGSAGPVSRLTNAVAQEVSSIGSSIGSSVSSGSSTVAGAVNGASPQTAGAVQNAGSSAGSAISDTSSTAAGAVNALGGGH